MPDVSRRETAGTATRPPDDSPWKAVIVVLLVCLFASVLVTTSAVLLRPLRQANEDNARFARLTGVLSGAGEVAGAEMRTLVIDLESGLPEQTLDAGAFRSQDLDAGLGAPVAIAKDRDIAGIGSRPPRALAHVHYRDGKIDTIVLPVHGRGFGSMLRGYLGLSADTGTVIGLTFYDHAETPGLGALIDHPAWLREWPGKEVWGAPSEPALGVADGPVDPEGPEARHLVDGLTGATWTGRGVTNLLRFWLGEDGYGPFLRNIRDGRVR